MEAKLFSLPGKVLYGPGAMALLPQHIQAMGRKKALIVTDPVVAKLGFPEKLGGLLKQAGIDYAVFDGVLTEPEDNYVYAGVAMLQQAGCDLVIGLGGGSAIDTAKAIAIMAKNEGKISDFEGRGVAIPGGRLPLIGIATTAGTASEVSNSTIITDTARRTKMVIKSDVVRPDFAVCDPELTYDLPQSVTAASGLDALAHAIEGYLSKNSQPLGDIIALDAIGLIYRNLPLAYADGHHVPARTNMMIGQMLAGITMGNASTAAMHGLSRPVGVRYHIGHGVGVAMFMPEVLAFTLLAAPEKFARMAKAMGLPVDGLSDLEAGRKVIEAAYELRKRLQIPTLREFGVDREDFLANIPAMLADKSGRTTNSLNALPPTDDDCRRIYEQVINE